MSEVYSRRYGHHFDYYLTDADRDAVVNEIINHFSKENKMHYRNGRKAKNGDKVAIMPTQYSKNMTVGILYDAVAGNDYCNGKIAITAPNDPCPNLKECLHLDDVLSQLPPDIPDISAPSTDTAPDA